MTNYPLQGDKQGKKKVGEIMEIPSLTIVVKHAGFQLLYRWGEGFWEMCFEGRIP